MCIVTKVFQAVVPLLIASTLAWAQADSSRLARDPAGADQRARQALRLSLDAALRTGNIKSACSLMASLGEMKDADSVALLAPLAEHENPNVRAAALSALAWTGNPSWADIALRVCDTATPETEPDAVGAALHLADAMAEHGGNWSAAIGLYVDILRRTSSTPMKAAVIKALGAWGDETVVEPIVEAASGGDSMLREAVIHAFEALRGRGAAQAMARVWKDLPPNTRLRLLDVFAQRRDPVFLPIMTDAVKNPDPLFREAGLNAMMASELPEAVGPILNAVHSMSPEDVTAIRESLMKMARVMQARGLGDVAGQIYAALYGVTPNNDERRLLLNNMAYAPVPDSFDAILAAISDPSLVEAAKPALVALADKLVQLHQPDQALKAYRIIAGLDGKPIAADSSLSVARQLGFITDWRVVGPFPWCDDSDWETPFVQEPGVDLSAAYTAGDKTMGWKPLETKEPSGLVDLSGAVARQDRCFAYAYAEIALDAGVNAEIRMGVDDGVRLWVNGKQVFENRLDRGVKIDEDAVTVQFAPGVNTLLLKISQASGGGRFCVRLLTAQGRPIVPLGR